MTSSLHDIDYRGPEALVSELLALAVPAIDHENGAHWILPVKWKSILFFLEIRSGKSSFVPCISHSIRGSPQTCHGSPSAASSAQPIVCSAL